ncbi:MAG TPA: tyrosine-protein phosphatase [Desulfobaccales bacterium]|nr:tyrosine-protein phosphatase [Desulfobaccales bacterium]
MSFSLQRAQRQISRGAVIAAAGLLLLTLIGCASTPTANRPETWAQPVKLEGVPNLYRVANELYRGDQPSPQGMQNLKELGLKTIINLRSFHSDRGEIGDTGLAYEHITMKAWHPEEKEAVRFLKIVTDPERTPVLVHCQHGSDRTGAMIAIYRIAVQGWSKTEAIREMTGGGFGFHYIWSNLPQWIENLDIERLKRQAGM